jgi:hypothetical protein
MPVAAPVLQPTSLLGDRRRFTRLQQIVSAWAQHAEGSLPQALVGLAAVKGAYRFFANRAIPPQAILQTARPDCLQKLAGEGRVLLIQDTTSLDFSAHPHTTGLGPTGTRQQATQGIFVHTCLAASTAGTPLGVVAQRLWVRDPTDVGTTHQRRTRPWAEKESYRWLTVEAASRAGLPAATESVTIADAEADIFALFAAPRPAQASLVIRVAQPHRRLAAAQPLANAVAAAPVWGRYTVTLPARATHPARTAVCQVQVLATALQPPRNQRGGDQWTTPVPVTVLRVTEPEPPPDAAPLCWLLLTTLPIRSFVDAATCIGYYTYRWLIEQYHFLLKTGCRVEQLQLQTAERLERAVAAACLVALRLLWLTALAREQPEAPCTVAFDAAEWQALCCASSQTATPPSQPPTLREAVRLVARLGGFLGRNGDGEPGALTLWRGLTRLRDLAALWRLLHPAPPVMESG